MNKRLLVFFLLFIAGTVSLYSQTGRIKIFSEVEGISIFVDEKLRGYNLSEIDSLEPGTHYVKVIKDGAIIFSELVNVVSGGVTTILVKNTGQVREAILNAKSNEIEQYKNQKIDIMLSKDYFTQSTGYSSSTYFPGYYAITGSTWSKSASYTSEITDWKIIQGGVKSISEQNLAYLAGNTAMMNIIDADIKRVNRTTTAGAIVFLVAIVPTGLLLADMLGSKPFLHKDPEHPTWEAVVGAGGIATCVISYAIVMNTHPRKHYYSVDQAVNDANKFNRDLRNKLGLPDDVDR